MPHELIQLPEVSEIKDLLTTAEHDIKEAIKEDAELATQSRLVLELMTILKEQIGSNEDLNKLSMKEKINVAAHLNFLQCLLEDFFFSDEDFEFDDEEFEEEDETEEEEEEKK